MINKNKIILIVVIIVVVIIIAFFTFRTEEKEPNVIKDGGIGIGLTDNNSAADIETIPIDNSVIDESGIVDINRIKEKELEIPDLNRKIVFSSSLSSDARDIILSNIATLVTQLREDLTSFQNWLGLAVQYKIAGDYIGARDVWEFINETSPGNSISFNNLGDLYHYDLKDLTKSEQNFRKSIENNTDNTQAYLGLHALYKYSYKQDTTLVVDVLLEGIESVENNIDLLTTLAAYYKERGNMAKGDPTNAKKYYEQALEEAQKMGDTQLIDTLTKEISNI